MFHGLNFQEPPDPADLAPVVTSLHASDDLEEIPEEAEPEPAEASASRPGVPAATDQKAPWEKKRLPQPPKKDELSKKPRTAEAVKADVEVKQEDVDEAALNRKIIQLLVT